MWAYLAKVSTIDFSLYIGSRPSGMGVSIQSYISRVVTNKTQKMNDKN